MYLIRELVGAFATPLLLALILGAVAVLFRVSHRRRTARWLFAGAAILGYLGSTNEVGDALLRPLELRYPPLRDGQPQISPDYIVVLGSGYSPRDGIPVTAALDPDGLVRVVEAVRLARRFGAARLVVSGGAPPGSVPPARGYAELARGLGLDAGSLSVLDTALNTGEEARSVVALLGKAPFILVTSAYHMPRAMLEMERAGASPIPAPTGQSTGEASAGSFRRWLPSGSGLSKNERALHEYLGLLALGGGVG